MAKSRLAAFNRMFLNKFSVLVHLLFTPWLVITYVLLAVLIRFKSLPRGQLHKPAKCGHREPPRTQSHAWVAATMIVRFRLGTPHTFQGFGKC